MKKVGRKVMGAFKKATGSSWSLSHGGSSLHHSTSYVPEPHERSSPRRRKKRMTTLTLASKVIVSSRGTSCRETAVSATQGFLTPTSYRK
jgi:hypothetical protein